MAVRSSQTLTFLRNGGATRVLIIFIAPAFTRAANRAVFYGHYCLVRVTFFELIISLCLLLCSQRFVCLFLLLFCLCCLFVLFFVFAREPWWSQFCCFRKHPFLPHFFYLFFLTFLHCCCSCGCCCFILFLFVLGFSFMVCCCCLFCFSLSLSIFFMGDNFTGRYVWGGGGGGEGRWKCLSTVKTSEKITTWHFGCCEEWTRRTCFVCHGI